MWPINGFYEYYLPEPVAVSGTYYIGWKQTSPNKLNIGFDKNINNQDKIFYDLGSGWNNTGFEGSLMMRPVFVSAMDSIIAGISTPNISKWSIYPNPASFQFTIDLLDERGKYYVHDLNGRLISQDFIYGSAFVDVSQFTNGVYIVSVEHENGSFSRDKIVIQH